MTCKQCQPLFSDLVEKALTPVLHQEVLSHLSSCASCRKSFRDFQRALHTLRAVRLEEPPPGLLESILAAAPRDAAVGRIEPSPAPERVAAGRQRRLPWLVAAAALLLCAVTGYLFVRERARFEAAARQERDLGRADERRLEDASKARGRLSAELRESIAAASRAREDAERAAQATRAEEARRRALEDRVLAMEAEARRRAEEVSSLEKETAASRGEAARLERELAAARAPRAPTSRAQGVPAAVAAGEGSRRARGVAFRTREGRLELSVRGPRDEVIPELFTIAADDSNPEVASLALNALENLIGPLEKGAGVTAEAPGPRGWLDRGIQGFATAIGMEERPSAPSAPAEADRAARLRALEEAWRSRADRNQE